LLGLLIANQLVIGGEVPELKPSFPDHAIVLKPGNNVPAGDAANKGAQLRSGPSVPVDINLPFSWTQEFVLREGSSGVVAVRGFDPDMQPLTYILPTAPPNIIRVQAFDAQTGALDVTIPAGSAGTSGQVDTIPFQVEARNVTNPQFFNLNFDIRPKKTKIRGAPLLVRTVGDIIRPGQIVRYVWTQTGGGEKSPKAEALFTGVTGQATGLASSTITQVLAVKARPVVLGYYLMTITPRDVRGEAPRGSTSNGQVIRCAFGSANLPPVTDGFSADSFTPAVGQTVTLQPNVVDPETGDSVFSNEAFDFGDGTTATGITGPTTHAYSTPGIYTLSCTVADAQGATATASDNIIVGATITPQIDFVVSKKIIPEEAGSGEPQTDSCTAKFSGIGAKAGDRIVFIYNRNRFGRTNASDPGDDTDIIVKGGGFNGITRLSKNFAVQTGPNSIIVTVNAAQFDRTGDPRLGRAEQKGIFKNQRIGVCVIPADGSTPKVQLYTGNISIKVKGGSAGGGGVIPEEILNGKSTLNQPNPKRQEITTDTTSNF
jgi:PKD repeat protein